MKTMKILLASTMTMGLLAQQPAQAALSFNFNYLNSVAGVGFSDATQGATRRAALNDAANALGAYFTNYNATLTYDVTSENSPSSSTLASAGSGFFPTPGFNNTLVQEKILNGGDPNGPAADGEINWNWGVSWGLTDPIASGPSGQFDFKSTAMHELLHSFGFSSAIAQGGKGGNNENPGTADAWMVADKFLTDNAGNHLINSSGVFDPAQVPTLTGGTVNNGTFFDGPNAKAANGGNPVNIFSPTTWQEGSSMGHLDDDFFTTQALLMESATDTGPGVRTLSGIEIGILKDIGYTQINASPVPVPAAVWLFGSGLMALFGLGRRKGGVKEA